MSPYNPRFLFVYDLPKNVSILKAILGNLMLNPGHVHPSELVVQLHHLVSRHTKVASFENTKAKEFGQYRLVFAFGHIHPRLKSAIDSESHTKHVS